MKCLFEVGAYPSVDLVFHSRATPPFIEILWQEDLLELLLVINDVNKKDDRYRWEASGSEPDNNRVFDTPNSPRPAGRVWNPAGRSAEHHGKTKPSSSPQPYAVHCMHT